MLENMDTMTLWTYSLVAGAVVILIVAVLLILLIVAARRVDKHALDIWEAGKQIAGNTVSIWMLNVTNRVAGQILEGAQSIDARAASIDNNIAALADALGQKR
jgi:heme/copper-type cytochrome/quinol oxidase subunit 2